MISLLHIENVAVIEKSDIEFSTGLNVLTGETGAGKSIIIDSIGMLLGSKTTRDIIRRGADYALVSGTFDSEPIIDWLHNNDIEADDDVIIQRKVNSDGKSTCKINGVPVSVSQLKDLSDYIVDIHGQNDGRALLDERTHICYLDRFGNYSQLINDYTDAFKEYCAIQKDIDSFTMDDIEKARVSDSLNYQIREIENADIKPGEYDSNVSRRDILRNSEKITELLNEASELLGVRRDGGAVDLLGTAAALLQKASSIVPEFEQAAKSINDAVFLVSDVSETITDFQDSLDFSPEEYDRLEERISLINRLMRKYNKSDDELLAYLDDCRNRLDEIQYSDDILLKLKDKLKAARIRCSSVAAKLTKERKITAGLLENRISAELRDLNMPAVVFQVEFSPLGGENGFDSTGDSAVRFVMSANSGETPGRISKIASGGELSRIMLAMKNVFAENDSVPTLIFDEIDTGVSGIAGQKVAEKLYTVGMHKQVMCVTHLPQIAAMADHHFEIIKKEQSGRTYTNVYELDNRGRCLELARLYGGDNISENTLSTAEEQINAANRFKQSVSGIQ